MKRIFGALLLVLQGAAAQAAGLPAKPLPKFYVDAHVYNQQDLPIQVTLDALPFRPLKKGEQAWFREQASSGTHSLRITGPDNQTRKVYVALSYGREVPGMGSIYTYCVNVKAFDAKSTPAWTLEVLAPDACKSKIAR